MLFRSIREARDGAYDLARMGELGREYVVTEADRSVAIGRYRALLADVIDRA